jgi:dihydroorotate dehydrogenase (fumarate)
VDPRTRPDMTSLPDLAHGRSRAGPLAGRVRASLHAITGVKAATDVAAYLLAGADVVMTATALLRHGAGHARVLLDGLSAWMTRQGFASVSGVRGLLAAPAAADGPALERADYVSALRAANRGQWASPGLS